MALVSLHIKAVLIILNGGKNSDEKCTLPPQNDNTHLMSGGSQHLQRERHAHINLHGMQLRSLLQF